MTRLTYVVAGQEVKTYQEALDLAKIYNAAIIQRYTPIRETPKMSPLRKAKRI